MPIRYVDVQPDDAKKPNKRDVAKPEPAPADAPSPEGELPLGGAAKPDAPKRKRK